MYIYIDSKMEWYKAFKRLILFKIPIDLDILLHILSICGFQDKFSLRLRIKVRDKFNDFCIDF